MQRNLVFFFLFFVLIQTYLQGQAAVWNPFDIRNRSQHWVDSMRAIVQVQGATMAVGSDSDTLPDDAPDPLVSMVPKTVAEDTVIPDGNPFDMTRSDQTSFDWEPVVETDSSARNDADLLFILIIMLMVVASALVALYRGYIWQVFKGLSRTNHLNILYRSQNSQMVFQRMMFHGFFCLSGGLFLYLILGFLKLDYWEEGFSLWIFCSLLLFAIYLLKSTLLRFLGWVFNMDKVMDEYNFIISVFNSAAGLILIPFIAMLAFGPVSWMQTIAVSGVALLAVLLVLRQFRVAIATLSKVLPIAFHFFIYLCAVEIAPVLLLASLYRLA
jgi:hypothetical protein